MSKANRQLVAETMRWLREGHPEKSDRYSLGDIGNGRLFADWAENKARYAPERKCWYVYTGRVWVPDKGGLKTMELCKKLADMLSVYAVSVENDDRRETYIKHVLKWQVRRYRESDFAAAMVKAGFQKIHPKNRNFYLGLRVDLGEKFGNPSAATH